MSIFRGNTPLKAFKGQYKPVNIYKGDTKLAGWHHENQVGEGMTFDNTYNDALDKCELSGSTVQMAEYYEKQGLSTQVQTVLGKNLCSSAFELGFIKDTGEETSSSVHSRSISLIKIEPLTVYTTISAEAYACYYDENKTFISRIYKSPLNTFTSISGAYYLRFYFISRTPDDILLQNFQLELGSVATTYEPFTANSPSPDYPSPITPNVLAGNYKVTTPYGIYEFTLPSDMHGIGGVNDRVVLDWVSGSGWLEGKIGKKIITDSGAWGFVTTLLSGTGCRFYTYSSGFKKNTGNDTANLICNKLKAVAWNSVTLTPTLNNVHTYSGDNRFGICLANSITGILDEDSSATKVSKLQVWLNANNLDVIYQLAAPTKTPLTFTKVASSTAPKFPMTFLDTTPSLEYPWGVYSAGGGNLVSRGKNLFPDFNNATDYASLRIFKQGGSISNSVNAIFSSSAIRIPAYNPGGASVTLSIGELLTGLLPNTEYRLSFTLTGTFTGRIYRCFGTSIYFGATRSVINIITDSNGAYHTDGRNITLYHNYSNDSINLKNTTDLIMSEFQIEEGSSATPYEPFSGYSSYPLPTLDAIGSVADTRDLATGENVQRISDYVVLDGSLSWSDGVPFGLNTNRISLPSFLDGSGTNKPHILQTYRSDITTGNYSDANIEGVYCGSGNRTLYITIPKTMSGVGSYLHMSIDECKAYFYGWKMCNADGTSPYYRSEVPYTPETWAEWVKTDVAGDSTGIEFVSNGVNPRLIRFATQLKSNTKYLLLYNVISSTITQNFRFGYNASTAFVAGTIPKAVGNQKQLLPTLNPIIDNRIELAIMHVTEPSGNSIKIEDFRIFEVPVGSQIESDANTKTADELNILYPFNGLCEPNWVKLTDGTGQTNILPTASYEGFTPYKMKYQLAEPIVTQIDPLTIPTQHPTTILEQDSLIKSVMDVTCKVMDYGRIGDYQNGSDFTLDKRA